MKKLIFALLAAVVAAVTALSVIAVQNTGEDMTAKAHTSNGFYMVDTDTYSPTDESERYIISDTGTGWRCTGIISDSRKQRFYDRDFFCADITDGNSGTGESVTFVFDTAEEELDLSKFAYLRFGLGIVASGENGGRNGFFVKVRLDGTDGTRIAHTLVGDVTASSGLGIVTVDTAGMTGKLMSVRITVYMNKGERPEQIKVSAPYLGTDISFFGYAEKYSAAFLGKGDGAFDAQTGEITTDRNGNAFVRADYAGEYVKSNGKTYMSLSLSGALSGAVSMTVGYVDGDSGMLAETESPRVSLYEGAEEYVFPFEINGSIVSYTVGLYSAIHSEPIVLDGVTMTAEREREYSEGIGRVDSIEKNGSAVRFAGTIERATAKKYQNADIGFFALPGKGQSGDSVLIDKIKITTKFEYTADISSAQFSPDTYMLMAAILTDGGEVIPIAPPRYADSAESGYSSVSNVGLYGASAAGAFESNASHVMLDLPIDDLYEPSNANAVTVPYQVYGADDGGRPYTTRLMYLDRAVLASLDEKINFYSSAGIRVYLRFVSSVPIGGLTYTDIWGKSYAVCPSGNESRHLFAETVRYLSERYSSLAGFVVCTDAARSNTVGTDVASDTVEYAKQLAELCRLTYNAARDSIENPIIAVPLSSGGDVTPSRLSTCLADALGAVGDIPWSLMYLTDSTEAETDRISAIGETLDELGLEPFDSMMIFIDGAVDGDAGEIADYCEMQSGAAAVFFSLDGSGLVSDSRFYSDLKSATHGGYVFEAEAPVTDSETDGQFVLWDFSDKYYTLGWRAVGVGRFASDYSRLGTDSAKRVLRADFASENGTSSGILLTDFDGTRDFTAAENIRFTLAVESEDCTDANIVFVVGTDMLRAEYTASVPTDGQMRTYTCDLTGYAYRDRADFVGIMVYADGEVSLECEKIGLTASDPAVLSAAMTENVGEEDSPRDATPAILLMAGCALVTVVVFILIIMKEKEGADSRENERKVYSRYE